MSALKKLNKVSPSAAAEGREDWKSTSIMHSELQPERKQLHPKLRVSASASRSGGIRASCHLRSQDGTAMPRRDSPNTSSSRAAARPALAFDSTRSSRGARPCPRGGYADRGGAQLTRRPTVSVMGSDTHIRAMWVRAADDQPTACICSACLICCSSTRRGTLIDLDIQ